jgi:hypothetical protein
MEVCFLLVFFFLDKLFLQQDSYERIGQGILNQSCTWAHEETLSGVGGVAHWTG